MGTQFDKKAMYKFLKQQSENIMDLLISYNVPDSVEDTDCDYYLLPNDKNSINKKISLTKNKRSSAAVDELQDRLAIIKNKMKTKKRPTSERALKKREEKKLKKNKEFKKVLVSAAKSIKNEQNKKQKQHNGIHVNGDYDDDDEEKPKPRIIPPKPIYNEDGKIVFSKFDFAAHPGAKIKKSHQNPREILKKIKETNKKISELKEQGDTEKISEIKSELAWQKAFERIEGKKVKDDPKLLYKTLKKKKIDKKKSKKQWQDRKQKVKSDIDHRQKKRQENIDKRSKDKKNKKLKRLSKKGRVIPGF